MKKIISLSLAVLLLVTLLMTATSCGMGMEGMTGFTRLRDHINNTVEKGGAIDLEGKSLGFASVKICVPASEDEDATDEVHVIAVRTNQAGSEAAYFTLIMNGSTEKARFIYRVVNTTDSTLLLGAEATVMLNSYTGSDLLELTSVTNILPTEEQNYREFLTSMLNSLLMVLDGYTTQVLDMDVHELGFIALSDKYMAPKDAVEEEEDLGGAFSGERLALAGLMIVMGIGMVFLVLAILWAVLAISQKVLYKNEPKAEKPKKTAPVAEETPVVAAPAPVAPADDAQLVAVITAAIAAAIESDADLSAEFIGGFRVVSFQKKSGKTSWNH